jgi:hypothetical protein
MGKNKFYKFETFWIWNLIIIMFVLFIIIFGIVSIFNLKYIVGVIIPLLFIVLIMYFNSRGIRIDSEGNVSVPGVGSYSKFQKNSFQFFKMSTLVEARSPKHSSNYYFEIHNIKDIYLLKNKEEMSAVSEAQKTYGLGKNVVVIEFRKPLKQSTPMLNLTNKTKPILKFEGINSISKIYVSLSRPYKFIEDIKELINEK